MPICHMKNPLSHIRISTLKCRSLAIQNSKSPTHCETNKPYSNNPFQNNNTIKTIFHYMTNHDHMFAPAATSRRNMFPQPKHSNNCGNPIFQLGKNIYIFLKKHNFTNPKNQAQTFSAKKQTQTQMLL